MIRERQSWSWWWQQSWYDKSELDGSEVDDSEVGDNEVGKKVQNLFKSKNLSKSKKMVGSDFFIPGAKLIFTKLK